MKHKIKLHFYRVEGDCVWAYWQPWYLRSQGKVVMFLIGAMR